MSATSLVDNGIVKKGMTGTIISTYKIGMNKEIHKIEFSDENNNKVYQYFYDNEIKRN